MFTLNLEKSEEPEKKIANIHWIIEKAKEFQKNIYFCFVDYAKAFDCVANQKLWKILQEIGIPTTWPASGEICMQLRKQHLELDMEQQTDSKSGKEYIKAIYCHCAYLIICRSIRNTGLDETQAGIKMAGRNINNSNMQMTSPLWQKVKRN